MDATVQEDLVRSLPTAKRVAVLLEDFLRAWHRLIGDAAVPVRTLFVVGDASAREGNDTMQRLLGMLAVAGSSRGRCHALGQALRHARDVRGRCGLTLEVASDGMPRTWRVSGTLREDAAAPAGNAEDDVARLFDGAPCPVCAHPERESIERAARAFETRWEAEESDLTWDSLVARVLRPRYGFDADGHAVVQHVAECMG